MALDEVDVVVVGAGLAGLTAARDLTAAGLEVRVLEARQRVGGRTVNHVFDDGTVVELGGQWIGPTQDRIAALAADLGVDTFPTHDEGDGLAAWGAEPVRVSGPSLGLPKVALAEVAVARARLERMARSIPLDAPWEAAKAEAWDAQTLESWIRRNLRTETAQGFFRVISRAVFSAEPADMSLLHFCFYVHSGGLLDRMLGTTGGAQQDRFVGGSQRVATRLAETLGLAVVVGAPVRRIDQDDHGVDVTHDRGSLRARRVVVATPPPLAARIAYSPPLPPERDQLLQKMPMGTVIKCMAVYERPYWRDDGLSGQAVSTTDPVSVAYDNSPPDGRPGVLLAFIEGRHARWAGQQPADERRRVVIDGLSRFFGPRARHPVDYVDLDWAAEEWTRGCYGAHLGPGVWTQWGPTLRRPCGRIHWAGTETAEVWTGYMDGAVRSGERVAEEVRKALGE